MSYKSLSHSKWDCKYHLVFIPKSRKKVLYGKIRTYLGPVFQELAGQRNSRILEGHMIQDHVHMLIEIPPKAVGKNKLYVLLTFNFVYLTIIIVNKAERERIKSQVEHRYRMLSACLTEEG